MNDTERLDWLGKYNRLSEVRWRIENEGETLRDAIDRLAVLQASEEAQREPSE